MAEFKASLGYILVKPYIKKKKKERMTDGNEDVGQGQTTLPYSSPAA